MDQKNLKVSIYLLSRIDAFTFIDSHKKRLQNRFPNLEIVLCTSSEEFKNNLQNSNIAITWKFEESWYQLSPNLKFIFTPAAGRDWIENDPSNNVNTIYGSYHGKIMGESLLAMILYMNRNFTGLLKSKADKKWNRNLQSTLSPLSGSTILIAGYGNIAKEFCKMISPFKCNIIGIQRKFSNTKEFNTDTVLIQKKDINIYLPIADHVISILPGDDSTDNFFTEEHFKLMKKSAYFYNIGRGNCVEDNLIDKMTKKGEIAGAALDVFNTEPLPETSPLWNNDKIFISPHSSAIFNNYLDLFLDEIEPKLVNIINEQD